MNHNENMDIDYYQDPDEEDRRAEYEYEQQKAYEELLLCQEEASYHHPDCPVSQYWNTLEWFAPCACKFIEEEDELREQEENS